LSERDELDRAIVRGIEEMGERVPLDGIATALDSLPSRSEAKRRVRLAWLAVPLVAALVIAVSIVRAPMLPPPTPAQQSSQATAAAGGPSGEPVPAFDVADWVNQRPLIAEGPFATIDASAYGLGSPARLSVMPLSGGAFTGVFGGNEAGNVLALESPEQVASLSRHVVRGRVAAISRPYFNSADGSFWLPQLVGTDAGRAVSPTLLRDVLLDVDAVLAGSPPIVDGHLVLTVRGGQAVIDVPTDVPFGKGYGSHVVESGRYLWSDEPETDLAIGEDVVLFLNDVGLDGLYAGDGTRFGYVFQLMPAAGPYYKFSPVGDMFVGPPLLKSVTLTPAQLDDLVRSPNLGSAAGPPPDDEIHEQSPSHSP
jgi:hypothetical protein